MTALRAVLEMHRDGLGESKSDLLASRIEYQDAVNAVVQRQEHGDEKPGDALAWEDGRAAVFQTAMLMFEFDRLLVVAPLYARLETASEIAASRLP
jgi:hypothetical protein